MSMIGGIILAALEALEGKVVITFFVIAHVLVGVGRVFLAVLLVEHHLLWVGVHLFYYNSRIKIWMANSDINTLSLYLIFITEFYISYEAPALLSLSYLFPSALTIGSIKHSAPINPSLSSLCYASAFQNFIPNPSHFLTLKLPNNSILISHRMKTPLWTSQKNR